MQKNPDYTTFYTKRLTNQVGQAGALTANQVSVVYANITGAARWNVYVKTVGACTVAYAYATALDLDDSPSATVPATHLITAVSGSPTGGTYGGTAATSTTTVANTATQAVAGGTATSGENYLKITVTDTTGSANTVTYLDLVTISYSV